MLMIKTDVLQIVNTIFNHICFKTATIEISTVIQTLTVVGVSKHPACAHCNCFSYQGGDSDYLSIYATL